MKIFHMRLYDNQDNEECPRTFEMQPSDCTIEMKESQDDCDDAIKNNQQEQGVAKEPAARHEATLDGHKSKSKSLPEESTKFEDLTRNYPTVVWQIVVAVGFLYFVWACVEIGKQIAR